LAIFILDKIAIFAKPKEIYYGRVKQTFIAHSSFPKDWSGLLLACY